jgi:hypothetical protein
MRQTMQMLHLMQLMQFDRMCPGKASGVQVKASE